MTYRFMGIYREQLWFSSPNLAACFLVMIAILCIGVFLCLVKRKNIYCNVVAILPASIAIFAQFLLVCSYSRGGYVAFATGVVTMIWLTRSKWVFLFCGAFALFLFLVENGVTRVCTIGEFADGSIRNRFLLWEGGMALIADSFHKGIQTTATIGEEYTIWFQPLWLDESYRLMINDFLTATCTWGIWGSAGILLLIATISFCGWQTQRRSKSSLLAGLLGCIVVFLASGAFSTMSFDSYTLKHIFVSALLLTLIWSIVFAIRKRYWQWRNLWIPAATVVCFCFLFIFACHFVRSGYPYRYKKTQIGDSVVTIVTPNASSNTILFVADTNERYVEVIRNKVRPLVEMGYRVYFTQVDSGRDGLQNTKDFLTFAINDSNNSSPILLMEGFAGKQLFIATAVELAIKSSQIIIHNMPESWVFPELSPIEFADKISGNVTFIKEYPQQMSALQQKMTIPTTDIVINKTPFPFTLINEIINKNKVKEEKPVLVVSKKSSDS